MYLNFWPESVDTLGWSPTDTLERNRARTLQIEGAAARAALASRTVAPLSSFQGMSKNIWNDAKNALAYMHTAGTGTPELVTGCDPFAGAPAVVSLNAESWSLHPPADRVCGASNPYAGVPWADAAMYRPALGGTDGSMADWIKQHPGRALLVALLGGFGLYTLGKK
jgi:hypothetical protein